MVDDSKYLNLTEIIKILKKRSLILIIIIISTLFVSMVYRILFSEPVFEMKGSLIIGSASDEVDKIQKYMPAYVKILKTNIVAQKTIEELNLDTSVSYLQRQLDIIAEPDTQFIEISLKWHDIVESKIILDKIIEVFIEEGTRIYPAFRIEVLETVYPYRLEGLSDKFYYLITLVLGGFIGLFAVFFTEFMDNTIKTEQDIENCLAVPVIGTIPKNKKTDTDISKLVDFTFSLFMESFRTLRTNLLYLSQRADIKTIIITSAMPREGKTTTASILAAALAKSGKSTLLVDCDLRNPAIHQIFSMPRTGLTNILASDAGLNETILESKIENLCIIPAGTKPLNPVELLASAHMKELILSLRPDFDFIILDTPPIGLVTEAQVLSRVADGYILVVSSGETEKHTVQKAQKLIYYADGSIIGAILNKLPQSDLHRRQYKYFL